MIRVDLIEMNKQDMIDISTKLINCKRRASSVFRLILSLLSWTALATATARALRLTLNAGSDHTFSKQGAACGSPFCIVA